MGLGQTLNRHGLADKLRLIRSEARHLHARLAKGDGRSETHSIYMRINQLRRDANEGPAHAVPHRRRDHYHGRDPRRLDAPAPYYMSS